MEPLPLQMRVPVVRQMVDIFWESVVSDTFPDEKIEGCFGIQKDPAPRTRAVNADFPIGNLTYAVWQGLFMSDLMKKETLVAALLEGRMPALFESLARTSPPSAYVAELLRRGFGGIKWDVQLMDRLSGKT